MDPLEGETRRVVECLEAEGITWAQVKLGMFIPRGVEWGYCEMPHRTEFPVGTADGWDISPESAGLLEEALWQLEAMLARMGLSQGGRAVGRGQSWLVPAMHQIAATSEGFMVPHTEYVEYQR